MSEPRDIIAEVIKQRNGWFYLSTVALSIADSIIKALGQHGYAITKEQE